MLAIKWLRLLMNHIPDKYEHLVRYYGYYSNRSRGGGRCFVRGQHRLQRAGGVPAPVGMGSGLTRLGIVRLYLAGIGHEDERRASRGSEDDSAPGD